ncbi:arsinothricin resistance N-acetyltransferase ArsN1 family B [Paraburkholderia sp.]|uniref:arsinothricin resistance N-acetyltransferase ArsN1 family B n=1 Tax=Paraburkholderia sp. TaxID=1926495 RepID=UPI003D6EBC1B
MTLRLATPDDAGQIADIYAPVVINTAISFELEPPTVEEMRSRIVGTLQCLPWLVSLDIDDRINGYAYASRHRERAAYQWSVDTTAYVREDCRGQGVGRSLYAALFDALVTLGYFQAFAGIALPNAASVGLHEAMGFEPLGVFRRVGFKLGDWRDVGWWQKELQPATPDPTPPRRVDRP